MHTGGCLCGAVRYEIDGRISPIAFCHCSKCRKSNGTAFHSGSLCRASRFRWVSGGDEITVYRTPSGYATQFCRTCGSPVPTPPNAEGLVSLPTGTLDEDPGSRPIFHFFVGSKAPWYEIADDLPRYAEAPPPPDAK
jgi:hypothetical protein